MNMPQKDELLSCFNVAQYFLILVDRELGDTITQLKLQKLIYFAQGNHLALFNKPLFKEEIEAWQHGPVVPCLRAIFGNFAATPIPSPGEIDFSIYNKLQKILIYNIYSFYGEHTAAYLRDLIRQHAIWQQAMICTNRIITKEEMSKFFKNQIKDIKDYLLVPAKENIVQIKNAEDRWLMNYDNGIPTTNDLKEIMHLITKASKEI